MVFLTTFFSHNAKDIDGHTTLFQQDTSRIIDISIKLLRDSGGFIKLFFDGKDPELLTVFTDCPYHRDVKYFGNDWKQYFSLRFPQAASNEDAMASYIDSMNIIVNTPNAYDSDIVFAYYYSYPLNNKACKNWFIKYIQANYPEYQLEVRADNVSFVV